jgi:PAS domain S-box-containing protein
MQRSKRDRIGFQTPAFATHLQNVPIGIGIFNDGTIKFANKKLCSMLGYAPKELAGKNIAILYSKSDGGDQSLHAILNTKENNKKTGAYETQCVSKNGEAIDIMLTVSPFESSDTLFTVIDISEYKKMEAAAQKSEDHIQSLRESATNFAVYRFAPDESAPLKVRVVFVSNSITGLLGLPDIAKFEKWFEVIHPDDLDRFLQKTEMAWEKHFFDETFRICHAIKKEIRWLRAITHDIVDENGNTKFMNGIFIDITDQKRAEAAIKQSEQALQEKTVSLRRANTELNALLKQRDEDRLEFETDVMSNAKAFILPYLDSLKRTGLSETQQTLLKTIDTNLNDMLKPLSAGDIIENLTSAEFQIANFVKLGKTSKEIAGILNVSANTVDTHRRNIRKKIGIKGGKGNLRTHLQSLS